MKVITNGKDKVYTTTCGKCNSDLEYTNADVFHTTEERRGGLRKTVGHLFKPDEHYVNVYLQNLRCVKCPVCGNIVKSIDFDNLSDMKTIRWERVE
jgi:hypothetical protein